MNRDRKMNIRKEVIKHNDFTEVNFYYKVERCRKIFKIQHVEWK